MVWIVPQKAGVYEYGQTAFIVSGHLKVMLEEDYLALSRHSEGGQRPTEESKGTLRSFAGTQDDKIHTIGSQIVRSIILPEIEKEINEGKNFSTLRQIFYAQVLAVWFKRNLKQALLNRVYANKSTVRGIDQNDTATNEAIYHQYLKAYKKGVFNYIKEDIDPVTQEALPRKYFSGGYGDSAQLSIQPTQLSYASMAEIPNDIDETVVVEMDKAQAAILTRNVDAAMTAILTPDGFKRLTSEIFFLMKLKLSCLWQALEVKRQEIFLHQGVIR